MKVWKKGLAGLVFLLVLGIVGFPGGEHRVRADAKAFEYIVPDADIRYLSETDISGMDLQVTCYAKNEIYARHGRMFASQELTDYFEEQVWYYGCISPSDFSTAVLNKYETANIKLLSDRETSLRSGGYVLDQPGYEFSSVYHYVYGNTAYTYKDSSYIFPDSDTRYLSSQDTRYLTVQEVCYGKNEIYARHGRKFQSQELTDYFNTKTWYYGSIEPSRFDNSVFNSYETANIQYLTDCENSWSGGKGYQLDQPGYNIYAVGGSEQSEEDGRLWNDYIFFDSDTRYLTDAEVSELSLQVLCYAKNEIYARRGRIFQSQELIDYFSTKPWYYGRIKPETFTPDIFNKYEAANVKLLDDYEHARDSRGYQLY